MSQVETYTPESLDEVSALLLAADGEAPSVVGGTVRLTYASGPKGVTRVVVDLARVPEMHRLEFDERNGLLVGAAVRLFELLRLSPVCRDYAILADGVEVEAERARATVGECLSGPAPDAEVAVPLMCLGACIVIFGPHGWSEMSVEALCAGRRGATLQPGDLIVGVRLPAPAARSGGAYVRSDRTQTVEGGGSVGAFLLMQDDLHTCCGARLAVSAEGAPPTRALDAERFLSGMALDERAVEEAGRLAAWGDGAPSSHAESDWRTAVQSAASQAIRRALERARS